MCIDRPTRRGVVAGVSPRIVAVCAPGCVGTDRSRHPCPPPGEPAWAVQPAPRPSAVLGSRPEPAGRGVGVSPRIETKAGQRGTAWVRAVLGRLRYTALRRTLAPRPPPGVVAGVSPRIESKAGAAGTWWTALGEADLGGLRYTAFGGGVGSPPPAARGGREPAGRSAAGWTALPPSREPALTRSAAGTTLVLVEAVSHRGRAGRGNYHSPWGSGAGDARNPHRDANGALPNIRSTQG